jgi:hypothetical protein
MYLLRYKKTRNQTTKQINSALLKFRTMIIPVTTQNQKCNVTWHKMFITSTHIYCSPRGLTVALSLRNSEFCTQTLLTGSRIIRTADKRSTPPLRH